MIRWLRRLWRLRRATRPTATSTAVVLPQHQAGDSLVVHVMTSDNSYAFTKRAGDEGPWEPHPDNPDDQVGLSND